MARGKSVGQRLVCYSAKLVPASVSSLWTVSYSVSSSGVDHASITTIVYSRSFLEVEAGRAQSSWPTTCVILAVCLARIGPCLQPCGCNYWSPHLPTVSDSPATRNNSSNDDGLSPPVQETTSPKQQQQQQQQRRSHPTTISEILLFNVCRRSSPNRTEPPPACCPPPPPYR